MESEKPRWRRSPVDAANVVVGFLAVGAIIAIAVFLEEATRGVSEDLVDLFERIPATLDQFLIGFIQIGLLAAVVGVLVLLVWKRMWGCLGVLVMAGAMGAAIGVAVFATIDDVVPRETALATKATSFVFGSGFPSPILISSMAAVVAAGAPWLARRYRRAAWILLVALAVLRILATTTIPTTVAGMMAAGFIAGSLTLLATGAPERRPGIAHVRAALDAAGIGTTELVWVEPDHRQTASLNLIGSVGDDPTVYVQVIDNDVREADLLFRLLNSIRVRGIEEEHPNRSAAQTVERAALGAMLAADAGVRTARIRAVTETTESASVLVADYIPARPLSNLEPFDIADDLLDELWQQVQLLQKSRIAHRRLDTSRILVTDDGGAGIVDFRASILAAGDAALKADIAELLTSLAVQIGPERAVASAASVLDPAVLAETLPVLQPLALTHGTRRQLSSRSDLLDDLRSEVESTTGVEDVELAQLKRITVWGVLTWIGVFVLGSFVLAVASNFGDIIDALSEASWGWILLTIVAVAFTYVAGAVLLIGTATVRLALPITSWMMLAQSFLNRFTPANSGGMAMRVRYLQRNGEGLGTAASTVGITTVIGSAMHWLILLTFVLWAGSTDETSFELPDVNVLTLIVVIGGVIAGVIFFTSWGRNAVQPWIREAWDTVGGQILMIVKSPGRIAAVLGGSAGSKLLLLFAFYFTLQAFGIEMSFVRACSLYLIATTIGAAVPTPGGVGGVEAALTAALTGAGVESGLAVSVVLAFRLVSYWLPVPFGWIALHNVQKRELL